MPMRKPPSLTTLAAPSFAGLRAPSPLLIDTLGALIAQLPRANRDLLRTIADLINATARKAAVTKMPLSNLLLVFCPSLHMSPTLVRVLCEARAVWTAPVRVLDIQPDALSRVIDIAPRAPSPADDGAHSVSRETSLSLTSDDDSALSGSLVSDRPAPSSSSDSFGPATPAEGASSPVVPGSPRVAFPSAGGGGPPSPAPISPKKSFPSLSLPGLGASPPPSPRALRMKRPSLTLLFSGSKRAPSPLVASISSPTLIDTGARTSPGMMSAASALSSFPFTSPLSALPSPYGEPLPSGHGAPQSPYGAPLSSGHGAPLSSGHGPLPSPYGQPSSPHGDRQGAASSSPYGDRQSAAPSPFAPPPRLDTAISSSPIQFTLDVASPTATDTPGTARPFGAFAAPHLSVNPTWAAGPDVARTSSSSTEGSYASARSARGRSASVGTLELDFGAEEDAPEEWTKSVLLAADVGPDFTSLSSVRDAIKAYETRGA
jgi:hypothetical protein